MTISRASPASVAPEGVMPTPIGISRHALYVPSQDVPLFAWIHQNPGVRRQNHAVLICAAAGCEQVHAHRALRHLADRLADAGFVAVRFDYVHTGDSADQAPSYAAWLANTRDVLAWMRAHLRCEQISVMGLRLGATLAVQAATEESLECLILWEPVVRGRAYARELKALSLMANQGAGVATDATSDIEAAGFVFPRNVVDEIGRVDLLKAAPKCIRALILARDDVATDDKLAQHLSALGISTTQAPLAGYADMLAEPHFSKVPHQAIAQSVDWLRATASHEDTPLGVNAIDDTPAVATRDTPKDAAALPGVASAIVSLAPTVVERIVRIGQAPSLFGILNEPAQATDLPVVVLPNAGSAYRVGPGRLYVALARRLAGLGFRCLRVDLSGLGDSDTSEGACENDCYAAAAFRDIDVTLKHVQTELGATRIVVMGLCSGAYVAFQAVAQIANAAFVESILINPLTYFWQDGMTLETSPARQHSQFQYYKASALQPGKWLKLLSGGTKIGIVGGIKMLAQRLRFGRQHAQQTTPAQAAPLGHPVNNDLTGDLERVHQAGRQLACFFSRSDPGYSLLMASASSKATQLCAAGQMSIHFIDGADHTFSRSAPRELFLKALAAYLCERYQR